MQNAANKVQLQRNCRREAQAQAQYVTKMYDWYTFASLPTVCTANNCIHLHIIIIIVEPRLFVVAGVVVVVAAQ